MFSSLLKNNSFRFLVAIITVLTLVGSPSVLSAGTKPKLKKQNSDFDLEKRIVIQNDSTMKFKFVVCEAGQPLQTANYIEPDSKSGDLFIVDNPDTIFDKSIEHNLVIMVISNEVVNDYSVPLQTLFENDFCSGSSLPLDKVNFNWKPGVVNTLVLKGNVSESGGSPVLYKPYQPTYGFYPSPYEKFVDLQPQSQKIEIRSYYHGTNYDLDIETGLNQYCVNGNLVNIVKKTGPTGFYYSNFYLESPSGAVNFSKPNFNFTNSCDTAETGEYKRVLNIASGTTRSFDLEETTDSPATIKQGIALSSFGPSSDTKLSTSEYVLCIDGIPTETTTGSFPITPGVHIISPSSSTNQINPTNAERCPPANQSLKLDIQANNSYTIKTFNTKGLDLVENLNSGIVLTPYQEGLSIYFLPNNLSICIDGVLQNNYTNFGSQGQDYTDRFYSKDPGTYDFNITENSNCNNPKYPKTSLEIQTGKFTNAEIGQFLNMSYAISGLTFESKTTVPNIPDLTVNLGNFSSGDKTTLKVRCSAGLCKVGKGDLPPSPDSASLNYDMEFEFANNFDDLKFKPKDDDDDDFDFEPINDINEFTVDLTLLNSSNAFSGLDGNLINGILFNSSCNSCLSKVTITMILTKGEADKYKEVKPYFSNSPWKSASILKKNDANSPISYTASVNGSFRQFAFAGVPLNSTSSLSQTGENIPVSLLISLIFISGCGVVGLKSIKSKN